MICLRNTYTHFVSAFFSISLVKPVNVLADKWHTIVWWITEDSLRGEGTSDEGFNNMGYSPVELEAIRVAMDVALSLSLAGSLFIISMYIFFPDLRAFAFKLIALMSLADVGKSICNSHPAYLLPPNGVFCYIAAAGDTFCSLASVLWSSVIALSMYITVVRNNPSVEQYQRYFHVYCWCLPLIIMPLPFSTDNYGPAQGWCWISADKGSLWLGTLWRLLAFYGPLWVIIPFNIYSYAKVIQIIKFSSIVSLNEDVEMRDTLIRRLRFYPAILILCYTPVTIKRIYDFIDPEEDNFTLSIIAATMMCLNGLCNALIYGLTDSVKSAISACIFRETRTSSRFSDDSISLSHRILYERKTDLN